MPSDRDSSPSDHIELEENCDNNLSIIDQDAAVVEVQGDFGVYQLVLFVITQLGYLPVAGGMLSTTFFEPTKVRFAGTIGLQDASKNCHLVIFWRKFFLQNGSCVFLCEKSIACMKKP